MLLGLDAITFHRLGLDGREPLLLMIGASLLTFAFTRVYTRVSRRRGWQSGSVSGVHLHHMVVGNILALACGMFEIAFQPHDIGVDLLAIGFGTGAALILDEFALSVHLRDVYWTPEGRHSIEMSIIWVLLGLFLLTGLAPFGIHDHTEVPRAVAFGVLSLNILLSVLTCLKGKLTLGLFSIFVPPVGLITAWRLARPGSLWAQLFYGPAKLTRAQVRFDPGHARLEGLRHRFTDMLGGSHDEPGEPSLARRAARTAR